MSLRAKTLVVGGRTSSDLVARCSLRLAERFALPASVTVRHGDALRRAPSNATEVQRILAFMLDLPGTARNFLGLLRGAEVVAALDGLAMVAPTVAVGVARGRATPVDDAVHLAVTTLIDRGHDIVRRADMLPPPVSLE